MTPSRKRALARLRELKAPTVAEFDLDVAMREHDEWEASESIACPHFEEHHKCATCIAELDAEIERDQRAEREELRRQVECELVPHEGDGGVDG